MVVTPAAVRTRAVVLYRKQLRDDLGMNLLHEHVDHFGNRCLIMPWLPPSVGWCHSLFVS